MRLIKRLGAVLIVVVLMLTLMIVPVAAETEGEEIVTDETVTVPEETPAEDNNTVIARVYEWTMDNIDKVLTALMTGVVGGFALYLKGKIGLLLQGVGGALKSQKDVESATQTATDAMIRLESKQAQLNEYYELYAKNEEDRNRVTAALLVENMALIEIQHISCLNNPYVPQAMKNLVTSKYARCLSVINDDAELKAAYDEMRNILGVSEEHSNEKTSA